MKKKINNIRIIGGKYKRTLIPVLKLKILRPSLNRIRETVFNWIFNLIYFNWKNIICIDFFSGTGMLGFEAASRGAKKIFLIEKNKKIFNNLFLIRKKLNINSIYIYNLCSIKILKNYYKYNNIFKKINLIFLDPPFSINFILELLLLCINVIKKNNYIYLETRLFLKNLKFKNLKILKKGNIGLVNFFLFQKI